MVSLEERTDLRPICPYCKRELDNVAYQEIKSFLGKRFIYYCPGCRSVLGVTHRKGFLMG